MFDDGAIDSLIGWQSKSSEVVTSYYRCRYLIIISNLVENAENAGPTFQSHALRLCGCLRLSSLFMPSLLMFYFEQLQVYKSTIMVVFTLWTNTASSTSNLSFYPIHTTTSLHLHFLSVSRPLYLFESS